MHDSDPLRDATYWVWQRAFWFDVYYVIYIFDGHGNAISKSLLLYKCSWIWYQFIFENNVAKM